MVPLKAGLRHNRFLLSVLPVQQCMFCGQNGIPPMVEVTLSDNNKVWLKENPVIVKGYVKLNEKDRSRVEIFIRDAALLKQ
jgi:long-subunit acyl-CoA synthetase (AMP-forming)